MARGVTLGRMSQPQPPELRASDAERERTADQLRHAAGEGRLTVEELDERLNAAYAARTRGDLEQLVRDVAVPVTTTGDAGLTVRRGGDPGLKLISIMGGTDVRRGRKLSRRERRAQRDLHRWHG
jgi:hypothetical protein